MSQTEGGGSFKGFKGFSLSTSPAAFTGFGDSGGFKGLGSLANGNGGAPSFGGFSSPPATMSTAAPGEDRLLIGSLMCVVIGGGLWRDEFV